MKKIITILCCILLMYSLTGCGKKEENTSAGADTSAAADNNSIGDIFKDNISYEFTDDYIKVVTEEYVYESTITSEVHEKLDAVDFFDEKKDEKYAEILTALPVEKKTPRSDYKLTPEKMSELIGKKGQELIDMGFENFGYNLSEENAVFFMGCNGYNYNVVTEEHYDESDSFFADEAFAESTSSPAR